MENIKVIKLLESLVSFDTSDPSKENKEILEFITQYLNQFPMQVDLIKSNYSNSKTLYAFTKYNDNPEILFSGHLDVIPVKNQKWDFDPFGLTINDGKVYGRGTSDIKGFIACVLSNLPNF
jgi:acetylornithine deacetylase